MAARAAAAAFAPASSLTATSPSHSSSVEVSAAESQRLVALLLALHPLLPVFMCAHEYRAALFALNSVLLYLHRVAVPAGA